VQRGTNIIFNPKSLYTGKTIVMHPYNVGVYTPNGRLVIIYYAVTRSEACNKAWGDGYTVVDCNYHDHD